MTETTTRRRRGQNEPETPETPAEGNTEGVTEGTEGTPAETPAETPARTRAKAPDTSEISLDAINAATLATPDLIAAAAPTRERSDQQKAMDRVAVRAYEAWREAGKPTQWQKMPVITYYLAPEDVAKYKYLIRRACDIVEPAEDSPGVRVKFGNEVTLSETMAQKVIDSAPRDPESGEFLLPGMTLEELAGKTVLAWTAIDKRNVADRDTSADTSPNVTEEQTGE